MKNTSQKGFNHLPETGPELVVDRDGKNMSCPIVGDNTGISGCTHISMGYTNEEMMRYMDAALNGAPDSELVRFTQVRTMPRTFHELKFKNGDFEK
jgi:hypothetical protein